MNAVQAKYKLPNVIAGVDGCHIPFLEKPRKIPVGRNPKAFINRKGIYSINSQIVGGIDRRIYDIQLGAPGSYHDAAVWQLSQTKAWFETSFPRRMILGDSAYALSTVLLTPYPEDQSRVDDNKCLFNIRHSGARVEMTENIYGMLKRRFPLVKNTRVELPNAVKVTAAAAVLHNMALDWADEMPMDDHPNYQHVPDDPVEEDQAVDEAMFINQLNPPQRRAHAAQARDRYRAMMDPVPTARELEKMALHRAQAEVRRRARR